MKSATCDLNHGLRITGLALCLAVLSSETWAGGILIYEAGQESNGLANAGAAALATDPSVLMSNPAGIAELQGTQVSANAQLILGDMRFSRDSSNQFDGNEGGNALQYLPGASLFVSHQIDERAAIGFGMYGNFGLALDYDDDWAGRYFNQEAAIIGISFQPTLAYKFTDELSIGVGPRIMYAYYRNETAINNNLLGLRDRPDGQLEFKDTDVGTGVNLGLLYKLSEHTQIGLAYTSKVDLEFKDKPSVHKVDNLILNGALNRLGADSLELDMSVPQTALVSIAHDLNAQWKLLGSLGWQDWSEFGNIGVEVDADALGVSRTADRKYKDTWHASVGAQYQLNPRLRLNMGLGYDSSAVDDEDRTVDNPMGEAWRLATGINYQVDEGLDLHAAYTLIWLGDMEVEQTKARSGDTLSGTYRNAALHVIGGGATWRF
ncbi:MULTISPECIES: OmpP1/FadL family transporter [Pseudomonas]|jgi:long-chain fatty acid transport protein|uniref:OmpP1/FadL family transporter n=1 Tax=Pseudomonas sp. Hg7Tf TaxID=3236988 RepID=A0AB39I677_9PSED|nr:MULTISPECIES: OmpP1/FadL family transporter [Pseudomonas]KJK07702.1 aromatic hydrocarbon degradation protein [Pseudomonas sp. 5]MDD1979298.1 OmpP1/FadL family transporter [Pseudomonas putida]MDH2558446.1 OmpP1/FadL family transporter [Pseudomonas sp. Hg5Tf]QYX48305.1 OmpP1/FadL family transporter [Pseudomonas sp. S11A 273]